MTADICIDSTRIESHEDFDVSVDFAFAALEDDSPTTEGLEYVISLQAESLDAHPAKVLGTQKGIITADGLGCVARETTISVAAGTLLPGSYKLASTLVVKGSPLAGYVEGPVIQVS